jgi:hypothetical protein
MLWVTSWLGETQNERCTFCTPHTSTMESTFVPRAEFTKETREPSSFALLTLAGNAAIQLAHFDFTLVSSLRHQLHPLHSHREIPEQSLFELTLTGKPWAHPKSLESEALFLSLLSTIFAHGYSLLSPIDYGKEEDGKLAIVFSKPHASLNHSSTSLPHHIPFAVSFPDKSTLRVINPPLHSTPAILQALRSAWPRGCSSENKIDGTSYEFKLKGYSSTSSHSTLRTIPHASDSFEGRHVP